MKFLTLMENTACREDLCAGHGLSLYIETTKHKILFDMGPSGAFAENAEALGVDLKQVDVAFLSHGHFDHSGGMEAFLKGNETAPVYLHKGAFGTAHPPWSERVTTKKTARHTACGFLFFI